MEAQSLQQTVRLDVLESYYIESKFRFHVISPAIVDEGDYMTSVDEERKSRGNTPPAQKKKDEKSKQTILLIAIKKGEVYSYVRETKLGKILGLSSKFVPRAISKHGLFIFAVEKKLNNFAVYEMTSGNLVKLITKPHISSMQDLIPYVSEDGNFAILFDKERFKLFFIYGIQQKNESDHAIDLKFEHNDNFKLIDYPDLGGDTYKGIVFYPFKYRAIDCALGIKADGTRVFTMSMLLESKRGEVVVCIVRIHTTDKAYKGHTIKLFHLEPSLHRDAGLYSLRLDDKDGDYLAVHCHNHHNSNSILYFMKPAKIQAESQDVTCLKFGQSKIIIEYQWVSIQQMKYLVYITRQLEIHVVDPEGEQVLFYFNQKAKNSIHLLSIFRRKVLEFSAIQLFNVNTEANLVLFFDKNIVSMDFSSFGDSRVTEGQQVPGGYSLESRKLILFDVIGDSANPAIENAESKKKLSYVEEMKTEESKPSISAHPSKTGLNASKKDLNQMSHTSGVIVQDLSKKTSQASIMAHDTSKKDLNQASHRSGMQVGTDINRGRSQVSEPEPDYQRSHSDVPVKKKNWFSSLFKDKSKKESVSPMSGVSFPENKNMKHQKNMSEGGMQMTSQSFFGSSKENLREDGSAKKLEQRQSQTKVENMQSPTQEESGRDFQGQGQGQGQEQPVIYKASTSQENIRGQGPTSSAKSLTVTKVGSGKIFMQDQQEEQNNQKSQASIMYNNSQAMLMKEESKNNIASTKSLFQKQSSAELKSINQINYLNPNAGKPDNLHSGMSKTSITISGAHLNDNTPVDPKELTISDTDQIEENLSTSKGLNQPGPKPMRLSHSWTSQQQPHDSKQSSKENLQNFTLVESGVKETKNINKDITKSMWDDLQANDSGNSSLVRSDKHLKKAEDFFEIPVIKREDYMGRKTQSNESKQENVFGFEIDKPSTADYLQPPKSGYMAGSFGLPGNGFSPSFTSPSFGTEEKIQFQNTNDNSMQNANQLKSLMPNRRKSDLQVTANNSSTETLRRNEEGHQKSDKKIDFVKKSVWSDEKIIIPGDSISNQSSKKTLEEFLYAEKPDKRKLDKDDTPSKVLTKDKKFGSLEPSPLMPAPEFLFTESPNKEEKAHQDSSVVTFRRSSPNKGQAEENKKKNGNFAAFRETKISGILEENESKLNETDIMLGQLVSSPTMGQRVEKVEFGTNRWRLRKSRESQEDGFGSKIREAVNKNPEKDSKDLRQIILGDKKEQTKVQDKKWTDAYGKRDFEEIKQSSSKDLKTEENQKQGKNDQQLFGGFKPQTNFDDFLYGNLTSTTEFKPKSVNVIDSNLRHLENKANPVKSSWDHEMNFFPDNERNLSNKQKELKGLDVKAVVTEQPSKTNTLQEGGRDDYYGKLPDVSIKNSEVLAPKLTGLKDNKNQTISPVKVFNNSFTQDQPQELKGYNDFKDFKKSPEPIKTSVRISKDSSNHSESPARQETIIYRLNETEQSPTREKTKSFQRYNPEPSARSTQTVKESREYETQRTSDKGASLSPMRQRERDENKSSIEHSGRKLVRSSKEKEGEVSFTVKKDTTKLQAQESIRIIEETKKSIEKSNSIVHQSVEKSKEEESKRERRQSRDFEESRLQSIDNTAKPKESLKEFKIEKIEELQSRPEKDVERNKVERDKSPLVRRYEAKGKSATALEDKNKDNAVEERKVMANEDHQNEKEESMIEKITEMYSNNNVVESIMINESKLEEIKNFEKQESQKIKDKTHDFNEPENLTKKSIEVELKVHSEFKNKEDTETFIREHTLEYNNHYLPEKLKRDTNKSAMTKDISTGDTRESSRPGSSGRRVRRSSLQEIKQDLSAIVSNKRDFFERAPQKSFTSQLNQSEIIIAQTDSSMLGGSILDKSRYNKKEKHTQQLDASPNVSRRREILNTISDKKNIQVYNQILPEKHKTQHQLEAGNRYSNVRNSRQLWDNNSKDHTKPSLDASIIEETHKDNVQKERKAQGDEVLPEIRSSSRKQKISLTPKQNARASSEQKKSVRISFKEPGQAESTSSSKLPIATTSGSKLKGIFSREENSRKSGTRQSKEVNQSKNIRSSITQSKTKILKSSLRKSNPIWRDSTIIKVKTETYDLGKTSNLEFQTIDLTQTEEIAPFGHSSTMTNMHERPSPLEKEGLEPYLKSLFHEEREQETFYQALQMFRDLPSEEGKLLGQLENIIIRFQEEFQGQMSEDLAKKVWLLLVHNLIRVFLKLKKDVKSYPRKHFLKLASMYFFVKDQLQRHIDSKKKIPVRRRQSLQKWQRMDEIPHPNKEQEGSNYLQPNRTSGHNLSRRSRSLQPSKDTKNSISQSRKSRQKESQEGQPAKSLRVSTEDIDKEKVIKKILLGLNEDDFNLVKIIKHLQSALVSKTTPTHIVGNCFFLFIVFLKSFVSAILDTNAENNTVNVIPAVLYKDILMKITDYTKAEEIESYLESCATKYSKYDRRAIKQDGGCAIRYQDLNITDLLLYLVNFLNYPRMFIDIAQFFIKADKTQVAGAPKYLIMILMFLNDKLELFTSKFETLRIVRDKTERSYSNAEMSQRTRFEGTADEIRFVIGEMLDILIGLNVSSDSENSHSSMVEPGRIVSLPVCLADMEVLKPDSFVLERACFKIFSELNEILQSLKQANNIKNFWVFVLANMNHCFDWQWFDIKPLGLGAQAQDIDIKCRDVTKDMKEKAFVILRSIYELSYFLNWKSFGANGEESPGPKPYLRALYRVARSLFYCFLKVQIELTKLVNNKNEEEYVVTCCRRGLFLCNMLVFPEYKEYEDQSQVEHELITVLETLNENERFIQPSLWSSLEWILQVIEFCVPSMMKMKCYRELISKKEEISKFSADEQSDMNENSVIRALFPKASVLKKRTMRESELAESNMEDSQTRYKTEQKRDYIETTQFNSFLQKILNLQATEQRESTGFEDFYLSQKDKCKEVIDLYSKMEQKYAPIFANQKKQTSNLLFDEGLWNFIVFPSEIKRFPQSRF